MSTSNNVSEWIVQAKDGDATATSHLWRHFYDRLVRAVRRRLQGHPRGVSDEEDIVLSVFDSFYAAVQQGRFPDLSDRDDLWRLLLSMSNRKVIDKRRHDLRQRRGGGVELISLDGDASTSIEIAGNEPSPEMVVMMQESMAQFFSQLGVGELQELAVAKLEGYSNAELARRFGCSERTIERRLHLIREKSQQEGGSSHEHSSQEITDRRPGEN